LVDLARDEPDRVRPRAAPAARVREPLELRDPVDPERERVLVLLRVPPAVRDDVRAADERPEVFRAVLARAVRRPPVRAPPSSPSSESPPISFFATPTAAGTATPIAAPATTFCGVESPVSSPSSVERSSSSAAIVSPPARAVARVR
jgi:hypothetical protein